MTQTQTLAPDDARLTWLGAIGLEHAPDGTIARRLTPGAKELFPSDLAVNLWNLAGHGAGVRITFETDATFVGGVCIYDSWMAPLDLVVDGEVVGSSKADENGEFGFDELGEGRKKVELWLPQRGLFRLRELRLSVGATVERAAPDRRPKWLTYGSSITHALEAHSPTQTWPAIVARRSGLNLTCLGFSGNCHLEPMVARVMREREADFISICAGINIASGSLSPRTFRSALIGFVQIVREKHLDTPLAVISPILSPPRETRIEGSPWSLPALRAETRAAVDALRKHGDEATFYIDGLDIVGPDEAYTMPDELHPDGDGQAVVADKFERVVGARLWGA